MADNQRERDLVLASNEYALILDQTKGHISVHSGPTRLSLSATDQPVRFTDNRRFVKCTLDESIQPFCLAQQGDYIQLANPAEDGKHPTTGSSLATPSLNNGRKVNIAGPISFALWPGQAARVIEGHTLASNQYLLVRVYDDKAAKEHLGNAVVKTTDSVDTKKELIKSDDLSIGKLIVIKGTEVNFFIPPTGLEVVPEEETSSYIREAVSLERLEYCLLLDQNGNKRYVRGPAVVFPEPTEIFVTEDDNRKFRAIELTANSGIHVKIIASYEENGVKYNAGDELFITGHEQRIYFPREEHAIIRQNDQQIHHGVTLPRGEARYVLDKDRGVIETTKGPQIFLPDPRKQLIVKRILSEPQCQLMYPGNTAALLHNQSLASQFKTQQQAAAFTKSISARNAIGSRGLRTDSLEASYLVAGAAPAAAGYKSGSTIVGDSFTQTLDYQQPQSITIDNKFDGAVTVSPWTGYAVMVKNKAGDRKVVLGPATTILEYDEELEVLALSKGKPKSDKELLKTVYLQVENNKISDIIEVETSDFTKAAITVSFRGNFIGDSSKWFNVSNYTKLLTEHMRSKIRRAVMQHEVESFYRNAADIIRDTVLGVVTENKRTGFTFAENNMHIYDVEVLEVKLLDTKIQQLLSEVQREGIDHAIQRARLKRDVEQTALIEDAKRKKIIILTESEDMKFDLQKKQASQDAEMQGIKFISGQSDRKNRQALAALDIDIRQAELKKETLSRQLDLEYAGKEQDLKIGYLQAEAASLAQKAAAVSPHLIKALQAFGDRTTLERLSLAISPFGMIDLVRGQSVFGTFKRLLVGSPLENLLDPNNGD